MKDTRRTPDNLLAVCLAVCLTLVLASQLAAADDVQTQSELQSRISSNDPAVHRFIKDKPILAWVLKTGRFDDIPSAIRKHLGTVDQTKYSDEYLAANLGGAVALQMDKDKPDFYIISKVVLMEKYEDVPFENVRTKNSKLLEQLKNAPEVLRLVEDRNPAIVAARKSVPVDMIKMSAIGYQTGGMVVIQSPWGEQTKPAGADGFLVFDNSNNQYYLVNQGENGNPLSYVPVP